MKIAIILDSLSRGGAERQAVYAVSELARQGRDVELIYYNQVTHRYDPALLPEERVHRLAKEGRKVRFVWELRNYLRDRRFGVVHGWMSGPGIYAGMAGPLGGIPVVFAGMRAEYKDRGLVRMAHRCVDRWVTGWIVNSKATVDSMVRDLGVRRDRIHVVYNGIDPDAFVSRFSPAEARQRLGLPADAPTVSIVGRLRPQKNHPLFIQTAARVAKSVPAARFLVVGDGDGQEQAQLEAQAERLGIRGQVVFLGSRSDIPDILAATDVMCLTSHYEGVANSLLEAMCARLPVVSTAYAGVEELVIHERNGLVAPMGDASGLATHLVRLLEDARLRLDLGQEGRRTVEARYTMEAMGRNLYGIYEKCYLAASGGGRREAAAS